MIFPTIIYGIVCYLLYFCNIKLSDVQMLVVLVVKLVKDVSSVVTRVVTEAKSVVSVATDVCQYIQILL